VRDEKGIREVEIRTGSHVDAPPVPWHEVSNIGVRLCVQAELGEQHSLQLHRMVAFAARPSYSDLANNLFASSCDNRCAFLVTRVETH
jgi:hypothetical protein